MKSITATVSAYFGEKKGGELGEALVLPIAVHLGGQGYNHSSGLLLRFFVGPMAIGVAQEAKVHLCCTPAA